MTRLLIPPQTPPDCPNPEKMIKCDNPIQLETGIKVGCRKCKHCLAKHRRFWIGRMAAEAFTSKAVRFVTLTYDPDHLSAARGLPTHHIKQYMKYRRRRYDLRHFTVGEYGEKTLRPHWHSIQFYQDKMPIEPLDFSDRYPHWTHGNSQYEVPRSVSASFSYLFDYLDKGGKGMRASAGLGKDYLMRYAREMARNKRLLISGEGGIQFTVPNAKTKQGTLWKYHVPCSHHYAAQMVDTYLDEWDEHWETEPNYSQFERVNYG